MTPLSPEDGRDRCPSCLGSEHLRQALTEDACINYSCMPLAVRTAKLIKGDSNFAEAGLLPWGTRHTVPPRFGLQAPEVRTVQEDVSVSKKK